MRSLIGFTLTVALLFSLNLCAFSAEKSSPRKILTETIIGKISAINMDESSIDVQYVADDMTKEMKTSTFYITEATVIDIATAKSSINDLKAGTNILLDYAIMPDGERVAESIWVKKSWRINSY